MPHLVRPEPARRAVSLVPLIDVFMILLVFFLVTSTYLDLDALPAAAPGDEPGTAPATADIPGAPSVLFLRLRDDGRLVLRGEVLSVDALAAPLAAWRSERPDGAVVLVPSGAARMQNLADLFDILRETGIGNLRVVRLEGPA